MVCAAASTPEKKKAASLQLTNFLVVHQAKLTGGEQHFTGIGASAVADEGSNEAEGADAGEGEGDDKGAGTGTGAGAGAGTGAGAGAGEGWQSAYA